MRKILVCLLFICSFYINTQAQIDTSFWFVAPDVSAALGDNPVNLHIQTYNQAATVYVRQPANSGGVNATLSIAAASVNVLNLTASLTSVESAPVNSVSTKGIYISSNANVSVYYTIGAGSNKEMISLKGQRALGNDFYTPIPNSLTTAVSYTDAGVGFDVVATKPGITTILITPRAASVGRAKNVTFSRSLLQGETFSLRDLNTVNPSELAGSIISADKLIAVTINGIVQTNTSCPSTYADQITASDQIGKDYVILRSQTGTTDVAYILATSNSSSLSITNSTATVNWLINFGETYSITITDPITYIKSDKPVYVLHASGYGCKLSAAQVSPVYCAGSYTAAFIRLSSDSLNLNVVTRTGNQNTFTLTSNGGNVPIAGSSFTAVPGSSGNLVAARLYFPVSSIALGSYNLLRNSKDLFGLGIKNGSSAGGSAYAYGSEFGANTFVYANSAPTATICSNTTFTLNGQVGGGPNTGVFSYNGFGTLSGSNTQLINNIYTPNPIDTNIKPVKFVLTSTGICPNKSDTFKLTVKQAPLVNAGFDITTCSNNPTVQLSGTVIGPTNQGFWSVMAPGSGTFTPSVSNFTAVYNLSNNDTMQSSLKIVLTSTNNAGCNAVSDTMKVIINKAPVVKSSLVKPIIRCANNPNIFLNGSVSGTTTSTGIWSTTGTGNFSPNNLSLICNYIPSLTDISTGTVSLKLTSTNNSQCKAVADSVIVIFTQPVTVSTGVDLNSCKNNPMVQLNAVITGTATNSGIWYNGAGTYSASNTALTPIYFASPSEVSAGFVVLSFSTTNNGICNGVSDQVRIDFREKPTAKFVVNNVCLNQPSNFTDQSINSSGLGSINSYQWLFGNGAVSNSVNPVYTYSVPGTYSVQLVVGSTFGCYDTIKKPLTVFVLPTASMQISRACSGSAQQISFTDKSTIASPGSIPATGYYWDFGGFGFSVSKDTSIVFPSEGLYNITHVVTSGNGCVSTITQSVNITPKPKAKFLYINSNTQTLETNIAFVDSSKSAVSWSWNFGNNTTSNIQNPSAIYNANGSYTVSLTITDQFGCADTYTAVVKISNIVSEIAQLIPNMISPNNDGKNDFWRLDFINVFYPKAEIEIYNRWGEQLFKSTGYSNAWDGSYKGSPLPVGGYYYTIKLNDNKDNSVYKGTVTLLK
ncbi:MAG: gliding motility-associated C-terminal domain-containing protein [Bacteroidetes bacterium]|nr:gliding motility-associated C-terminal domain-containing protein [Bacteroidota bacterium]